MKRRSGSRKRVLALIGTRPEAIKMAPVVSNLLADERLSVETALTGQHAHMVLPMLEDLGVRKTTKLDIDDSHGDLNLLIANCLNSISLKLVKDKPDMVIAQGDTATVFAAATAAFNCKIPFAHVEAGLRSYDLQNPWPEEGYRRMIDQISSLHLCPTANNKKELRRDGINVDSAFVTGNTVVDAVKMIPETPSMALRSLNGDKLTVVWTMHRRESIGEPMVEMVAALRELALKRKNMVFVVPVHPNPEVTRAVNKLKGLSNVALVAPMRYKDFINLMRGARLIVTDSGGIQEESPTIRVPAIVMRDTTERQEGISSGWVQVVGRKKDSIVKNVLATLDDFKVPKTTNPFGDGNSSWRIRTAVLWKLGLDPVPPRDWQP